MIIYTNQRSKKKKISKKQNEQYESWLSSVNSIKTNFSINKTQSPTTVKKAFVEKKFVRETQKYPSLVENNVHQGGCTKPIEGKKYTGSNMKGIGTLHKSNGIPVFSEQEAKDLSSMRR
jgi:hypothetical protein